MASLKELKKRKESVQSTKKITGAMKMISAVKLRRAQDRLHATLPYANLMSSLLLDLIKKSESFESTPKLLLGTGKDLRHMVILVTSDRGLCGGFNGTTYRQSLKFVKSLEAEGKTFQIMTIGKKGYEAYGSSKYSKYLDGSYLSTIKNAWLQARRISAKLQEMFENDEFDVCTIIYNKFISSITQEVTNHRLIPYTPLGDEMAIREMDYATGLHSLYEYEPSEEKLLADLLPQNFTVQIFRAMLESATSEYGARMTAMDSATRNADDMIKNLNLVYNRTRQAIVTRELIEIISGAEAL